QTSFIPTLTLGIPGSATMALMLGALMIQNIVPGPRMIEQHPAVFWGLIASMVVGNMMLLVLNVPLVGLWVKVARVPERWLFPAVLVFCCIGAFAITNNGSEILLLAMFGAFGYGCLKLGFEMPPFILGFVLAPLLEE